MAERERFTDRWHGAIRDWPKPLTLAWGMQDPVARVEVLDGHADVIEVTLRNVDRFESVLLEFDPVAIDEPALDDEERRIANGVLVEHLARRAAVAPPAAKAAAISPLKLMIAAR